MYLWRQRACHISPHKNTLIYLWKSIFVYGSANMKLAVFFYPNKLNYNWKLYIFEEQHPDGFLGLCTAVNKAFEQVRQWEWYLFQLCHICAPFIFTIVARRKKIMIINIIDSSCYSDEGVKTHVRISLYAASNVLCWQHSVQTRALRQVIQKCYKSDLVRLPSWLSGQPIKLPSD